ncbi:unnamed protein product [Moneuplotes crassus]|uniref:Uncharacterized protein n=1 Tax=Euplotes crassus TaxID=5936 RepID=A0AAD1XBR9_EUPCR|nr:unnamed protein product [Moneuplotes crassus]
MEESKTDMDDYLQTQSDKKLVNTPTKSYAMTTDYEFGRLSINHQANERDEYLKQRLERIKVMRDFDQSKDIHEYDYTDVKRRGDGIIYRNRPQNYYTKYQPNSLNEEEEVEKTNKLGLSRYLKLLSEEKIKDNNVSPEDLDALKRLSRKYRDSLHYQEGDELEEREENKRSEIDNSVEREPKEETKEYITETPENYKYPSPDSKNDTFKRYLPFSDSPSNVSSFRKSNFKPTKSNKITPKRVHYEESAEEDPSEEGPSEDPRFMPTQTRDLGETTKFDVRSPADTILHQMEQTEREDFLETIDNYNESKAYYLDDGTLYFTNGPFYKEEMHSRVERHHKELIRNPDKLTNLVPGFYNVSGGYHKSREERNQEFIDQAYYDVCIRGYLRNRKRYRTSYPIYGENLHEPRSSNRVILHDPQNIRGGTKMYSNITQKEVEESFA